MNKKYPNKQIFITFEFILVVERKLEKFGSDDPVNLNRNISFIKLE